MDAPAQETMTIERIARRLGWSSQFEGDIWPGGDCWEDFYDPRGNWTPAMPTTVEELIEEMEDDF